MIQYFIDTALKQLRDPSFQAITGLVIAFISGIVVPFVLPALQQRRGKIAYMYRVVGNEMKTHPKYGPGPFHTIEWTIWNYGNKAVEIGDYRKDPIEFTFGNMASVEEVKTVESKMALSPIIKGNRCELAPVFLDKDHLITLEFLVKDADVKRTKVDIVLAGHDPIDVIARAERLLKIVFALLVVWALTFIAHWRFPQIPIVYYVLIGLAFFISLLGTRSIIYLVSSLLRR